LRQRFTYFEVVIDGKTLIFKWDGKNHKYIIKDIGTGETFVVSEAKGKIIANFVKWLKKLGGKE